MAAGKTLYIADDNDDDVFFMQQAILDLGLDFDVRRAENGMELISIVDKTLQNVLVLADINMPGMNGIEALSVIHVDPGFKHFRSILISTSDSKEMKELALTCGAMKFIAKPTHYEGYLRLMNDIYYKCF